MNAIENKKFQPHCSTPPSSLPCYSFCDDSTAEASDSSTRKPIVNLVLLKIAEAPHTEQTC